MSERRSKPSDNTPAERAAWNAGRVIGRILWVVIVMCVCALLIAGTYKLVLSMFEVC